MISTETELRERWLTLKSVYPLDECARIFVERRWVYGRAKGPDGIPTRDEIVACLDELFERCISRVIGDGAAEMWCGSGRFIVSIDNGMVGIESEALDGPGRGSGIGRSIWGDTELSLSESAESEP